MGVWVRLRSVDSGEERGSALVRQDGKFFLSGVEPGRYLIRASYSSGKNNLESAPIELQLEGADATGLEFALAPSEELTGTLELAGEPKERAFAEHMTVRLTGNGFDYDPQCRGTA
jgi:hypothetical protein